MRSVVDPKWLSNCEEYLASQEKAKYLTKGAVFSYESGKPAIVICGRNATHALIINKRKALFIEPKSGGSREDEIDVVLRNFSPLQADHLPVLTDMAGYREVGDLLFDITQPVPVLKARLAKGLKAKQLGRHRAQNQALMSQAIHQVDFSSKFQSGAWFT
jgi:hypothetical protein